jgi:hypothetical protein
MALIMTIVYRLLDRILNGVVHIVAVFGACVLSRPSMQRAAAEAIILSIVKFVRQPSLGERLLVASESLSKAKEDIARRQGHVFPKTTKNFLKGMFLGKHGGKEETPQQVRDRNQMSKESLESKSAKEEKIRHDKQQRAEEEGSTSDSSECESPKMTGKNLGRPAFFEEDCDILSKE